MFQRLLMIFVLAVCMSLFGCSTMKYLDGSSDEDMEKFRISKDALWNEVKKLKQDRETSEQVIQNKQAEIDRLNQQMTNLNEGIEAAKKETETLKKELHQAVVEAKKDTARADGEDRIADNLTSPLQEKSADIEKKDAVQPSVTEKGIEPKMVKVKVLSGNGKISSAKALSVKLAALGYKVENIGMALRSNFNVNTVYYAPDYQKEAQRMAVQLGSDSISKPLTWSSAFHIIVVTGP